jgi:hypothetical protein
VSVTVIIVAYRERMLCNERMISGYTRAVSGQRLGKHFFISRQQILNNATAGRNNSL